ncbi:MAG: hypothetical protein ACQESD_02900 [Thermoplasmatota archaeon]
MLIFDDICSTVVFGGLFYAIIVGVITSLIPIYKRWQMITIFILVVVLALLFSYLFTPLTLLSGGLILLLFVYRWGRTGSQENITHHGWGFGGGNVYFLNDKDTVVDEDIQVPNEFLFAISTLLTLVIAVVYIAIVFAFF